MARMISIEGTSLVYALLLLLPALIFIILKIFKPTKSLPLPPGPRPWPLLGNVHQIGAKPHITLANLASYYGPIMSVKLGTKLMVVGSSPEAAKEILTTQDRVLSGRHVPHSLPFKGSESINTISMVWATECDEAWKTFRSVSRADMFSSKALESQAGLRERKALELVRQIGRMEGKAVKIAEAVFAVVFDSLSAILMSRDFIGVEGGSGVEGEMKQIFREILEVGSAPNLSDLYPVLGGLDLQGINKRNSQLHTKVYSMWASTIKERRERKDSRDSRKPDLLDVLIENNFVDAQINQYFLEIFVAGTDTSSSTIEWAMAELVGNPRLMAKLREDLAREINQDVLNESQLSQLPYLQACIKETLRLHPATPLLLPRRAADTCQVMNYTIPKGTQIAVNAWAIGRDPKFWEEPLSFRPERFLNNRTDFKGNDDFKFVPFGGGKRICPGIPVVARQVPLILASLIYFFEWSLPEGADPKIDMTEKFGTTLQKEQPLLLVPKARRPV